MKGAAQRRSIRLKKRSDSQPESPIAASADEGNDLLLGPSLGGIPRPPRRNGLYYIPGTDIINGMEQEYERARACLFVGPHVLALSRFDRVPEQLCTSTMFLNVVALKLSRNKITEVDLRLARLQKLTQLGLDENSIAHLPEELCLLTNLTMLDVRHNKLVGLPKEIFRLSKLAKLFLQNNVIKKLPATLSQLTALESLALRGNLLKSLPVDLGANLSALQVLDVADNKLETVDALTGLGGLRRLYLKNNRIEGLPAGIATLTALENLSLASNRLALLCDELCQLTRLTELDVSQNALTALPARLGDLKELQLLYVDNNQLTALPDSIELLSALLELHAANNALTAMPAGCAMGCNALGTIDLSYNAFSTFPPLPSKALRVLKLNGNELTQLPEQMNFERLTTLDLGFNKLHGGLGGLVKCPTLQQLVLTSNSLRKFPPPLPTLQKLIIEANQLESIPLDVYKFSSLTELNISHNELDDLPVTLVAISTLHLLVLDNNPFGAIPEHVERRGVPMWKYLIAEAEALGRRAE